MFYLLCSWVFVIPTFLAIFSEVSLQPSIEIIKVKTVTKNKIMHTRYNLGADQTYCKRLDRPNLLYITFSTLNIAFSLFIWAS